MDQEEMGWVLRAQRGDPQAFEALVRRYDRRILGLAYDMVGDPEDAQDVFQEALISAYRALPGFRMESEFFTWLYRIAVNKALKFRRRRAGGKGRPGTHAEEDEGARGNGVEAADNRTPETLALDRELQGQIERALEGLSAHERMAFVLCHHQGFKICQAAGLMSCSEGSVKSYLFRAREKMRAALCEYIET